MCYGSQKEVHYKVYVIQQQMDFIQSDFAMTITAQERSMETCKPCRYKNRKWIRHYDTSIYTGGECYYILRWSVQC